MNEKRGMKNEKRGEGGRMGSKDSEVTKEDAAGRKGTNGD
jgi:hypothetical protein